MHLDVDVRDLDDFYAFTGHKLYGPTGIGVLYGKHELLDAMPPFNGGGEMIQASPRPDHLGEPPHRFEAGTPAIVQAIGLGAAIDYVNSIGKPPSARTKGAGRLRARAPRPNQFVAIIGNAPDKGPIISFEIERAHPHDIATLIDRAGVAVRAGTHCVMPLLARFGRHRHVPRVVCHVQHQDEVDVLAASLIKAQEFFA